MSSPYELEDGTVRYTNFFQFCRDVEFRDLATLREYGFSVADVLNPTKRAIPAELFSSKPGKEWCIGVVITA